MFLAFYLQLLDRSEKIWIEIRQSNSWQSCFVFVACSASFFLRMKGRACELLKRSDHFVCKKQYSLLTDDYGPFINRMRTSDGTWSSSSTPTFVQKMKKIEKNKIWDILNRIKLPLKTSSIPIPSLKTGFGSIPPILLMNYNQWNTNYSTSFQHFSHYWSLPSVAKPSRSVNSPETSVTVRLAVI